MPSGGLALLSTLRPDGGTFVGMSEDCGWRCPGGPELPRTALLECAITAIIVKGSAAQIDRLLRRVGDLTVVTQTVTDV